MRLRSSIIILIGLCSTAAFGQQCPASVDDSHSRRLLAGMDIIEGKLHAEEGANAILAPESFGDHESYWKFRGPIGVHMVWMRCVYRDTSLRVTQRVSATATECREARVPSTAPGEEPIVHATCSAPSGKSQ